MNEIIARYNEPKRNEDGKLIYGVSYPLMSLRDVVPTILHCLKNNQRVRWINIEKGSYGKAS